jgi:RND family efflux transporter MFP subunit
LTSLGCDQKSETTTALKTDKAEPVTAAPITARRVDYVLEQVGSLQSGQKATLRAQVAGVVKDILFQEGGPVQKGQLLVKLDDAKVRAEIRNLEALTKQHQTRLAFQLKTLDRNRTLRKKAAIAQHKLDELESQVKETQLAIAQAQASLARQKEILQETSIKAPFNGVVGAKNLSLGNYLKAGDPVVTVVVLDPLEISFQVPEVYKSRITLGQNVKLRVASEGERFFEGTIFFIAPMVEEKTRTFEVKARVANTKGRLNPGMFARVRLVTEVHESAATVPWGSVIQTENENYIYLLEQGKARKVTVELGKITPEWAEILQPKLSLQGQVIVEGKFRVREGGTVSLQQSAQPEK